MKARINLAKMPSQPGYYAMMRDEDEYDCVKAEKIGWERSKRVTHYLVPASVFERLLNLDRASEKMCGRWEYLPDENGKVKPCCSCCKVYAKDELHLSNFCPECGADLREPEEYAEDDPNKPEVSGSAS